jgi:hypothetical protein
MSFPKVCSMKVKWKFLKLLFTAKITTLRSRLLISPNERLIFQLKVLVLSKLLFKRMQRHAETCLLGLNQSYTVFGCCF